MSLGKEEHLSHPEVSFELVVLVLVILIEDDGGDKCPVMVKVFVGSFEFEPGFFFVELCLFHLEQELSYLVVNSILDL